MSERARVCEARGKTHATTEEARAASNCRLTLPRRTFSTSDTITMFVRWCRYVGVREAFCVLVAAVVGRVEAFGVNQH